MDWQGDSYSVYFLLNHIQNYTQFKKKYIYVFARIIKTKGLFTLFD